ncbi:hypothetical protein HG531_002715 [Fusarium graminearum]|nr:hypothetical protein HG531_002715 [Fusarium graminearum]
MASCVARSIRILQRHKAFGACILFQFLMFGAFDEVIDASLSQQVCFGFFSGASLPVVGALIHPFYTVDFLFAACGFELALHFLLCALFFDLVEALLGSFSFGEGLLLLIPNGLLIAPKRGMEGLFQVEIAAAHCDDVWLMMEWRVVHWPKKVYQSLSSYLLSPMPQ